MRKIVSAIAFLLIASCFSLAADPSAALKKADQDWEKATEAKNINSFMSFIADDIDESGLDGKWIHGKAATREMFSKLLGDPSFKLTWKLESAEVSRDGHFGYTRGTFQASQEGKPLSGAYATFWKTDKQGKWQAVVDIATPQPQP